jgi:16S rRNA (guanine(966)-N(2))-methyltransferase RsmD
MSRIRITGGICRSRLIEVASVAGLRPTPDRVRETLFNWLGQDLSGLACLDLFAGSGILGLEAASRGADFVTLIEHDRVASKLLTKNANALALKGVEIKCCDALKFATFPDRRYDVIFVDPPYRMGWIERIAPLLAGLSADDARIYVEAEQALEAPGTAQEWQRVWQESWQLLRQGRAGQVHYHLFGRNEQAE